MDQIISTLSAELGQKTVYIENVVKLLDEAAENERYGKAHEDFPRLALSQIFHI